LSWNSIEEIALQNTVYQRRRQRNLRKYFHNKFTKGQDIGLGELIV
jgi:hypothetical protein